MRLRAALKTSIRDCIKNNLGYAEQEIAVCPPPGRPHPVATASYFVAICDAGQTSQHLLSVDSTYTFQAVLSKAVGNVPFDRLGSGLIDVTEGLNERAEAIASLVFKNQWQIVTDSDANMSGAAIVNGILQAPHPTMIGVPEEVGWDWFGAVAPQGKTPGQRIPAGYKITVTFDCRLMQTIDGSTF